MSSFNTIVLKGEPRHDEMPASAALSPGHLIELLSTGKVRKHASAGGTAERLFAKEQALSGGTVSTAFAADDLVPIAVCDGDDEVQARVPASAAAIVKGDKLVSNGDGTLIKPATLGTHTLYSNTAPSAAVSNTTTETAFDKSFAIPANSLVAGEVLTIQGQGIATATNSTDTLRCKLYLGTTVIADTGALDVANNDIFTFQATLIIRTIGASGTFVAEGEVSIGTPGTATVKTFVLGSTAIDTTVANTLAIKATWSVANAGNSVRLDVMDVESSPVSPEKILAVACEALDNSAGVAEAFLWVRCL